MNIVIDTTQLKIREYLEELCEYAGFDETRMDSLWMELLSDKQLYGEFIFYLENHTFKDELTVQGYSLSDIYVWQMDKYNLISEIGKNPVSCNKETMVLKAFETMSKMIDNPEEYVKRIEEGRGNDRL